MKRRGFLKLSSAMIALQVGMGSVPVFAAEPELSDPKVEACFVGPNALQLRITDTVLTRPKPEAFEREGTIRWDPNPFNNFGSGGRLNGVRGVFSGDQNTTLPQTFRPWPEVIENSRISAFDAMDTTTGVTAADNPEGWALSVDGAPVAIENIFRKSMPVETLAVAKRVWESRKRHTVTLLVEAPIPDQAEVTLETPWGSTVRFGRSDQIPSENIHICQEGYALSGPKKAYVGQWFGHDAEGNSGTTDDILAPATGWRLIDVSDGAAVAGGKLTLAKAGIDPHRQDINFNGCDIYAADFSGFNRIGTFRLEIPGVGASQVFKILPNPYTETLRLAARWYFHQRSGIEITPDFGEGRSRPRNGHPDDGLTVWQTAVKLGPTSEGFGGPNSNKVLAEAERQPGASETPPLPGQPNPNAWGGWHDAGDWDRRVQHLNVVHHMAAMVEQFPEMATLNLNIPESGRRFDDPKVHARKNATDRGDGKTILPDIIHEALWGISLWRRTQHPDGGIIGGVEYSTSGIAGSVSWNPVQLTYAYAPDAWSAFWFVYGAAKLGHVIGRYCGDEVLSDALLQEARLAWDWAEAQHADRIATANDISEKEASATIHIRVAAAATLYHATGAETAQRVFEDHNPFAPQNPGEVRHERAAVFTGASLDYLRAARAGRPHNPEITGAIEHWVSRTARRDRAMGADYGLHNSAVFPWGRGWLRFGPGSNWRAGQIAHGLITDGMLLNDQKDAAIEGMWFALGCNPSNTSFIQGLGHRQFESPLCLDLPFGETIPGQISFGVSGGPMHNWEQRKTEGIFYPREQMDWPIYTQIFESAEVGICAEHGIKSNALEWMYASALVNHILTDQTKTGPH